MRARGVERDRRLPRARADRRRRRPARRPVPAPPSRRHCGRRARRRLRMARGSLARELGNRGIEQRRQPAPGQTAAAMRSRGPDRIEAETDGRWRRAQCRRVRPSAASQGRRVSRPSRTGIELDRDAGIEMHAVEHSRECLLGGGEPVAVRADRAGEDEHEPGRAVFEIVQRLGVCRRTDRDGRPALDDRPRRRAHAPRPAARRPPAVERLDRRARHRSCRRAACRTARP